MYPSQPAPCGSGLASWWRKRQGLARGFLLQREPIIEASLGLTVCQVNVNFFFNLLASLFFHWICRQHASHLKAAAGLALGFAVCESS